MYYMGLRALSDDEFSVVLGIVVIIIAFAMMSLFYIFSYIFAHIRYKHRINRRKRLMKDLQPSIDIPDYSPAIMSYLVYFS